MLPGSSDRIIIVGEHYDRASAGDGAAARMGAVIESSYGQLRARVFGTPSNFPIALTGRYTPDGFKPAMTLLGPELFLDQSVRIRCLERCRPTSASVH